jgi:glycosyltransferase involved in cell wall biosynthesis
MDMILTNSKLIKKQLIEKEGVREQKILVIKNFFKYSKKKINLKKKLGLKSSDKLFGIVANLIPYKNHLHIIKACANLKFKNWKLLFIGEDRKNYKLELQREIKKLALENNIIFTGFIDNIEICLKDLEFIVNASTEEGSSNSLLQALGSGVPILASNIDTNREFVEHKKNGFLYKKGNIKDLTKYLELFLRCKDIQNMRIESKKIFDSKFNLKRSVDDYFDIYQKLIG